MWKRNQLLFLVKVSTTGKSNEKIIKNFKKT